MKKGILLAALAVICVAICAYGTIAYFTADDTAANVITAGNVNIELQENMIAKESGETVAFQDQTGVMPGSEVSKIVQIKNTGDQPVYVRISMDTAIALVNGSPDEADLSLISFDIDTENWTLQNGFYYYNAPLAAGETTVPFFTKVVFAKDMDNKYQNCTTTVRIDAAATQTANNGADALHAAGWPDAE